MQRTELHRMCSSPFTVGLKKKKKKKQTWSWSSSTLARLLDQGIWQRRCASCVLWQQECLHFLNSWAWGDTSVWNAHSWPRKPGDILTRKKKNQNTVWSKFWVIYSKKVLVTLSSIGCKLQTQRWRQVQKYGPQARTFYRKTLAEAINICFHLSFEARTKLMPGSRLVIQGAN